jgi:hypothetical protein
MASPFSFGKYGKVIALAGAVLLIPVLAYIGHNTGPETDGKAGSSHPIVCTVPEANTGLVLIPFFGAVLLFSSLHVLRSKSAQKEGGR